MILGQLLKFNDIKDNKMFKCLTPADESLHAVKAANPTLQDGVLDLTVHLSKGFSPDYEWVPCSKSALRPLKTGCLISYHPQPEGWGWQLIL